MQSNSQPHNLFRPRNYLLIILVIAGIYSYAPEQKNKPNKNNNAHEQTNASTQLQTEQESSEISFDDFLSALKQEQQHVKDEESTSELSIANHDISNNGSPAQNENDAAINNLITEENKAQQLQKETEYRQLIADFNQVDGNDKLLLLQRIWQLAPEVGIDENLLTLLQLATYDPDAQVEKISREILNDLQRFKDGTVSQEEQLVSEIMEMNKNQQGSDRTLADNKPQTDEQTELNTASLVEMAQQKSEKIDQLTKLALTDENTKTKEYALMSLVQLDHDAALDVIQHQLLNSNSSDERFKAIEILRSSIGDYDSDKIRPILEMTSNDYDTGISETASDTLEMLDNYTQAQNNPPPQIQYETSEQHGGQVGITGRDNRP